MIKKICVLSLVLLPIFAFAQQDSSSTSALQTQIQELLKQVQQLQTQVSQQSSASTSGSPVLTRTLTIGSTGSDVTAVQQYLSTDSSIYPEGLVTGYYGTLTANAVSRYQEKVGLESVGIVGPKTMAELNQVITPTAFSANVSSTGSYITPNGDVCRTSDILTQGISTIFPVNMICATINRNYVYEMDYQGGDGKCYHVAYTGTNEIACNTNKMPPKLPNGEIPSPFDSTFNWSLANGHCYYTSGDTGNVATGGALYGGASEKICGVSSGGGSHVLTILKVVNGGTGTGTTANTANTATTNTTTTTTNTNATVGSVVGSAEWYQNLNTTIQNAKNMLANITTNSAGTSNTPILGKIDPTMSFVSSAYLYDPTAIDYLGTLTSGGTISNFSSSCDQSRMETGYKAIYNPNPANPPVDVACKTVGKGWIGSMDYKGSDNMCYHADWTGTYKMDCLTLQKITGYIPPTLPNNIIPTNIYDSTFGWAAYNTKCYYTTGDTALAAPYGVPGPVICGAFHGTASLLPTLSQVINSTGTQFNPFSTALNPMSLLLGEYIYNPTAIDYLGTLASGGTVSGLGPTCDQTQMNAGYKAAYNPNPANPPVDVACKTVGKGWIGSMDYKGSDNMCHHADWTGTYKIDCVALQKILGYAPQTLPNNTIPTNIYDSTFNWSAYNTQCYYTAGDLPSFGVNNYGIPTPVICGAFHGLPTTSTTPAAFTPTGKSCSRNTDCNDGNSNTTDLCFGASPYVQGYCSSF